MAHEVFISHATEDRRVAVEVCDALEAAGTRCWMAPRDVPTGSDYPHELVKAIEGCRLVVLLLSEASNASRFVPMEIERAVSYDRRILTVRLADLQPATSMELFVSSGQWFNAFDRPPAAFLRDLVGRVQSQLTLVRPQPGAARTAAERWAVRVPEPAVRRHEPSDEAIESLETVEDRLEHLQAPARVRTPPAPPQVTAARPAATRRKIALVYRRRAKPDDQVLAFLESQLVKAGHTVFIDRHLTIGMEWAAQIEQEVKSADAIVPLLSREAVQSEMLTYEVQLAHQAAQANGGRPHLFPVRIMYEDRLPNELAPILDPVQYFAWNGPEDNQKLVDQLTAAFENPPRPRKMTLESTGGAVPLDSEYYVERPTDELFRAAIERRDSIILLNGARQMGKTSLLARGLQKARSSRVGVVLTDYQKLTAGELTSLEQFYLALAEMIVDQLDLDADPRENWKPTRSPNANFERFIKRQVLGGIESHLLWAMDEVDRVFTFPYSGEVFGLFRAWHNERALDPSGPWGRLTLAIAYATEAHLFITDPNQSPFNVGTRLALEDFTAQQVAELNRRHGSPLKGEAELARLYELIAGQPYLNRRGMYEMVDRKLGLEEFAARADRDDGPFGDHLRRLLVLLAQNEALTAAMREMVEGRPCPTADAFFRLRGAGLLAGTAREDARLRCRIYQTYLKRHLL